MVSVVEDFNTISLHAPFEKPEVMVLYKDVEEIKELDNRGEFIHRPLFSHSDIPHWLGLDSIHANNFNWEDECVYSVLLHHRNELAARHLNIIPGSVLDAVRALKCKLILDNVLEGDNALPFFEEIYKSIDKLNLPGAQIYYITNNLLAEGTHKQWCESNNVSNKINVISFMYNVHDVKRLINTPLYKNPIIETETEKVVSPYKLTALPSKVCIEDEIEYKRSNINNLKHFLKVNRTNREERNLFMLFLNQHKLLDKCRISFPHFPSNYTYEGKFKYLLYRNNVEDLLKKVPFDIDETDRTNHGPAGFQLNNFNADLPFNPVHYRDTFISVVMCAFPLVENACHLHSSTYNPIYCGHPVIQFGPYRHLKELKNRGFKTFSKWWDESYDDIEDPWVRLQAVMDLILKLSNKTNEEMLEMYIDMKDTLQYNTDLIKNFDGIEDLKKFIL